MKEAVGWHCLEYAGIGGNEPEYAVIGRNRLEQPVKCCTGLIISYLVTIRFFFGLNPIKTVSKFLYWLKRDSNLK